MPCAVQTAPPQTTRSFNAGSCIKKIKKLEKYSIVVRSQYVLLVFRIPPPPETSLTSRYRNGFFFVRVWPCVMGLKYVSAADRTVSYWCVVPTYCRNDNYMSLRLSPLSITPLTAYGQMTTDVRFSVRYPVLMLKTHWYACAIHCRHLVLEFSAFLWFITMSSIVCSVRGKSADGVVLKKNLLHPIVSDVFRPEMFREKRRQTLFQKHPLCETNVV